MIFNLPRTNCNCLFLNKKMAISERAALNPNKIISTRWSAAKVFTPVEEVSNGKTKGSMPIIIKAISR